MVAADAGTVARRARQLRATMRSVGWAPTASRCVWLRCNVWLRCSVCRAGPGPTGCAAQLGCCHTPVVPCVRSAASVGSCGAVRGSSAQRTAAPAKVLRLPSRPPVQPGWRQPRSGALGGGCCSGGVRVRGGYWMGPRRLAALTAPGRRDDGKTSWRLTAARRCVAAAGACRCSSGRAFRRSAAVRGQVAAGRVAN